MSKFPAITDLARPFRSVALESTDGSRYFESAIIGPDDQIECRAECDYDAPHMIKKAAKINDLYERGFIVGRLSAGDTRACPQCGGGVFTKIGRKVSCLQCGRVNKP